MSDTGPRHGGDRVAAVLAEHGVRFLFTLCGGHISPILVGCKERGIRVVDTRHEATAVFAADATARLSGVPGVAAVTAGPGATNTITAVKNAQLAQSPVVLLGGATATVLKGRGSLQDIDQMALFAPHVKWAIAVKRVRDLAPAVAEAMARCCSGVPGPVFVECPVDLLYPEELVRSWYLASAKGRGLAARTLALYLRRHLARVFAAGRAAAVPARAQPQRAPSGAVRRAASLLARAQRPVLVVGSQALVEAGRAGAVAAAVEAIGAPVFLSGMARGLLGRGHPLQLRHRRREALREADLVLLAGVPCDFRLDYGRHIGRRSVLVSVNRSSHDLEKNRRPKLGVLADAGGFLEELAGALGDASGERWAEWQARLRGRDDEREGEIAARPGGGDGEGVDPVALCRRIEETLPDDSLLVADGGDFVGTASYLVSPRAPLSWLDPGVFGTLGVGAGFALGAKLCRPESEVWVLFGDGSFGYSLAEIDTFVRHRIPILAVVGNDACWAQIAREQVEVLGDDVGCALSRTDYHRAAEGLGAHGFAIRDAGETEAVLRQAQAALGTGLPVVVNAHLRRSDFRKGSISI